MGDYFGSEQHLLDLSAGVVGVGAEVARLRKQALWLSLVVVGLAIVILVNLVIG